MLTFVPSGLTTILLRFFFSSCTEINYRHGNCPHRRTDDIQVPGRRRNRVQSRNRHPYRGRACYGVAHRVLKGKQHTLKDVPKSELGFICLSGLATGASWLCYYKALQGGLASVVVPIDKLSILRSFWRFCLSWCTGIFDTLSANHITSRL